MNRQKFQEICQTLLQEKPKSFITRQYENKIHKMGEDLMRLAAKPKPVQCGICHHIIDNENYIYIYEHGQIAQIICGQDKGRCGTKSKGRRPRILNKRVDLLSLNS